MSDTINTDIEPLITVIVPVYNVIEYLPRCVHSIMEQTYKNLEIILVDDGSTDGTGILCDELGNEDSRIKVLHKENGGSSSARNLGLLYASGEYIGFIDSDDYADSDMYSLLYEGITAYNVKIAQIGRDEIASDGSRLPNICEPPVSPVCIDSEAFMRELLMHRGDCSFCTKLTHRSLLCENREPFPIGRLNEDFALLVRLLPKTEGLVSLPKQAYHVFYRIGSNSRKADRDSFSEVFGDCVDNADMAAEIVKENYPALEDEAFRFGVFQRIEYLLHIPVCLMTGDNVQYREIVAWMRCNLLKSMGNRYLTIKNKCYHIILAAAPRTARRLHRKIRALK
ncbi:MAG: glycosyltransferase [Lachnospiraceae bacterium]|nr:glycosyltransferase [Lachnospiraceae bacterium]